MLTSSDAAHLLRRVGFGGTTAEISHFQGMTREDAVDEILGINPSEPSEPGFIHNPEWWVRLADLRWWWFDRMIAARWVNRSNSTPSPLVEKMALFWHSHFATGVSKVEDLSACYHQNHILRRDGLGDFHDLLYNVCTDGALLRYLDNDSNEKDNPQENFARELMELYTIGPDDFTEQDVVEMARAWTGHGIVGWVGYWDATYQYRSNLHDNGSKALFGISARNWNGPDTLDELVYGVKQDACARFLVGKLWRYFVNDQPSAGHIDEMVDAFTPSMNITTLLRELLLHDEFWAAGTRYGLVRSPVEIVTDVLKRTGLAPEDSGLQWNMGGMGQELFEPPSVAGWGTNAYWVSTTGAWGKADFLSHLRWQQPVHSTFEDLMDEPNAAAGAQRIIDVFGLTNVSAQTRSALEDFWDDHDQRDGWAAKHNALMVGALCPEFQVA